MEERFEKLWFAKTNYFLIGFSVTQIQLENAHKNKLRLSNIGKWPKRFTMTLAKSLTKVSKATVILCLDVNFSWRTS